MEIYHERGSITLTAVFVYFVFTSIGLGLIFAAQVYAKLSAHKKNMTLLAYASENGIKRGFENLADAVEKRAAPVPCTENQYLQFRGNAQAGSIEIAELALGTDFPALIDETAGDLGWRSSADFSLNGLDLQESYFLAEFRGAVAGEGRLNGFGPQKKSSLDISLKALAGHIPLAYFPFLISGNHSPEEQESYRQSQNIVFIPAGGSRVLPQMSFLENPVFPSDVDPLLKKALKIFSPDKLTLAQLRSALGLEMINEPVPEGVYLIHNDSGLGGIFAQGDFDEVILAIEAGCQVISFRRGQSRWVLSFSPSQFKTNFITPTETLSFDRVPLGIIMVNGRISSLGGGIINGSGLAELTLDESIPSVLHGVLLTIVSADEVTLTSHLIQQGVKWLDGIPYLKDSTSQLVLYAHGRDFLDGADRAGKILVGPDAPADLKIQANLAARTALELAGTNHALVVSGGLQTSNVNSGSNTVKILPDERFLTGEIAPPDSPTTFYPVLAILCIRPLQWNEQ